MNERRRLLRLTAASGMAGLLAAALPWPLRALADAGSDREHLVLRLADQTGLAPREIRRVLDGARFVPTVIERMKSPYEARPYAEYRPLFVTESMRRDGRAFLETHHAWFAKVHEKYAVEPALIAAILGLETRFGRHAGKDRVLDALFTLATGWPPRASFFTRELGEFLLLCREERLNPGAITGSYAGAFGATQFIPSSFRAYAVDEDGDGRRDVWHSIPDILGSVANYFHRHGWEAGRPVARWLPAGSASQAIRRLATDRLDRWQRLDALPLPRRLRPGAPWRADDRVAVIEMAPEGGPRLALVHHNFHVITRWNRSWNYAMATAEVAAMLGCRTCAVS
ncbi:MAG: lytic murein transglycosylase [Mariprofundaceae bacterium]